VSAWLVARVSGWSLVAGAGPFAWTVFAVLPLAAVLATHHPLPRHPLPRHPRRRLRAAPLASALVALYAFEIELRYLEISREELELSGLTEPLRVVLRADIQTDRVTAWEHEVLAEVRALEPDLLLLVGDYLHLAGDGRERLAPPRRAGA
jgi:hypothetical protein